MEMCERNPLNPGYVGSLLNFAAPDSLYFSNLRGNGAHIPGLHQFPYNRREVGTLPWTSSSSCTSGPAAPPQGRAFGGGYCPPFLSGSASSGGGVKAPSEESAYLQTEEGTYAGAHGATGRPHGATGRPHGPAAQLDAESAHPLHVNGNKQEPINPAHPAASSHTCSRTTFAEGAPWCASRANSRKKRKPYSKPQLAELESEFTLSEFINRQRRKELSDRLELSDQQVKIWFQNRRMKKKRMMMREQAFY